LKIRISQHYIVFADKAAAVYRVRQDDGALCVTRSKSSRAIRSFGRLVGFFRQTTRLGTASNQAAQPDFNLDRIQAQFMHALRGVAKPAN